MVAAELDIADPAKGADGLYSLRVKGTDYSHEPILWAMPRGRSL